MGLFISNKGGKQAMATDDVTPVDSPVEGTEEPQEPIQEEETQEDLTEPKEPDPMNKMQNDLQTWMGRKLKERDDDLMGNFAKLLNEQQQTQPQPQQVNYPTVNDDPEPDPELDVKGWTQWYTREQTRRTEQNQQQQVQAQQQAEKTYFNTLANPQTRHKDEGVHEAVMKELETSGHNQNLDPSTGQALTPAADAMLNYRKALQTVYERQLAPTDTPPNPLEGNGPVKSGLGSSQPGVPEQGSSAAMPRLGSAAQKLVSYSGWNAEKVRKVLSNK